MSVIGRTRGKKDVLSMALFLAETWACSVARLFAGQHDESVDLRLVRDGHGAGGFGGDLAGLVLVLDDLRSRATAGHEEPAPVILELARGHADGVFQELLLRLARLGDDDHDAGIAERDAFAEEDRFHAFGIEVLAAEALVTDERGLAAQAPRERQTGGAKQEEIFSHD